MALRARLAPPRNINHDWPWHKVKSSLLRASLFFSGDRRMEAENFLASGFGARLAVEAKTRGWARLADVARVWQPSRLKGILVSPEFGTPFLAATQVYDVHPVPRKWLSLDRTSDSKERFVSSGTILLTCSGSVGRATLANSTTERVLISHDLLRIEAREQDWWGWIYAYLRAPTVREMMKSARYGHIIKHLEISHLDALPIIALRSELRAPFAEHAHKIISLRELAHKLVDKAETAYGDAIGILPDLGDGSLGFSTRATAMFGRGNRLEGNYHNPIARAAERAIRSGRRKVQPLHELVDRIFVPGRFKHVYGDEGIPYLDSAQILEIAPDIEKRVLSLKGEKQAGYLIDRGTLLMPCSGQVHGIIGSVVLAAEWHENKILTNHIMRVIPKRRPDVRMGYLQAVLSHPQLGRPRVLKGAFGSSVPELSPVDVADLAIPRVGGSIEDEIADAMEEAAKLRAEADELEERIATDAEDILSAYLSGATKQIQDIQTRSAKL
jgi:hypothetical protein